MNKASQITMAKVKLNPPEPHEQLRFAAALRTMHRAATGTASPTENIAGAIGEELDLTAADRHSLSETDPRRFGVYQRLCNQTLQHTLRLEIPLSCTQLASSLTTWTKRFLATQVNRSALLRDMAYAFVIWASPLWGQDDNLPDFLPDLARYELFEFSVLCATNSLAPENPSELHPERRLHLDDSVRLARFGYAVHEWQPDARDPRSTKPEKQAIQLLGYRDKAHNFGYIELNPFAFDIVAQCLLQQATLGQSMASACQKYRRPVDKSVIQGTAQVLASLAQEGILYGSLDPAAAHQAQTGKAWQAWLFEGTL